MTPLEVSYCTRRLHLILPATMAYICLTMGLSFLLAIEAAFAQSTISSEEDDLPLLDSTQEQTSWMILNAACWMDDFFNDDRLTSEENRTRIRLELGFGYSKNESFEIKPDISGRIHLPHLNKKLNLLIFASNKDEFTADQNPISSSPRHQEPDNREISAALQYFLQEGEKYNISTTFGASFKYLFAGIRYRQAQDFGSWQGRFVNRIQYFTDDGLEDTISYDLEHYFSDQWLFRTSVTADWFKNKNGLPHSLLFRVYQIINEENALLYEVGDFFDTEPSYKMTDLQLRLRYRQRFLRDWLILEMSPQLTFPEDHDRKANPGIIIKFEADCGNLSGRDIFSGIFSF
jgi:hypothetical protein